MIRSFELAGTEVAYPFTVQMGGTIAYARFSAIVGNELRIGRSIALAQNF